MSDSLALLSLVTGEFDVRPLSDGVTFEVPVREVSGETRTYCLSLDAVDNVVKAREVVPQHLPAACPDRHINGDGTFCMHWEYDESGRVTDEASAKVWWARLLAFLRAQRRAERARRWTAGKTWAHGLAAVHQKEAEKAASSLGADFEEALHERRLSAKWSKHKTRAGDRLLYLIHRGKVVAAARGQPLRMVNKRQACICVLGDIKRHRRLRSCGTHAQDALALVNAILGWQDQEMRFWKSQERQPCCGTMDSCPLKISGASQSTKKDESCVLTES